MLTAVKPVLPESRTFLGEAGVDPRKVWCPVGSFAALQSASLRLR